ncbi:MAG: helix-turn-helix transcriptional regulator [Treponema sp.]|nr:helix-turn-helix transcriptional regulator [Treponema sp.]
MDFRERLREEIAFSGLSNKEVAALSGITIRTLVSYVSGQSCMPSADVAVRLAKALNTSVEYLITGEKTKIHTEKSSADARKLLHIYETLSDAQQRLLLLIAEDIAKCLR